MNLSQSEQSQDSDDFGVEFVNTSNSNNECESGLGGYVNLSSELSLNREMYTFLLASMSALTAFW